jgi:glycosyltransferase involved in cell wall biosynthesis
LSYKEEIAVIIPAYNPDQKLLTLLKQLAEAGFQNIVIIDDGSREENRHIFTQAAEICDCRILKHHVNLGKGRALKDGFNHVLNELPHCAGAITLDADGQHSVEDAVKCAEETLNHPTALIMGCRNFFDKNVPFRSRFGNILTRKVIGILCGIRVSDTQTGLRGFSRELMKQFLTVSGERFEYEMNMLIKTRELDIKLLEVPIKTIYIEGNKSSHFNPILDSIKVYATFAKYILSALSSFAVDILLFTLLVWLLRPVLEYYIYIATAGARVVSSLLNFMLNKTRVFKNASSGRLQIVKYYILCTVQMIVSAVCVNYIFIYTGMNETVGKIVIDTILFFVNYIIQREWVFKND